MATKSTRASKGGFGLLRRRSLLKADASQSSENDAQRLVSAGDCTADDVL
eukprot:CAMPEP_0185557008 /NCGR_PEP_ID=MMETSP1381-20130426/48668_1 /TAXON_ID=298111 /ORGANISM="Pavlova sp., Strain CCMP459" /LENGTH=49 /DNA_ID=CAMNT_0028170425 /DNA_START=28 /DNA_END=178 /DNA_ORIENTATION=+